MTSVTETVITLSSIPGREQTHYNWKSIREEVIKTTIPHVNYVGRKRKI